MPCQCPACRSPFITNRAHLRIVPDRADHIAPAAPVQRDHMREGRAC